MDQCASASFLPKNPKSLHVTQQGTVRSKSLAEAVTYGPHVSLPLACIISHNCPCAAHASATESNDHMRAAQDHACAAQV